MSLHPRQRRGANDWTEPQTFSASDVAVDVTKGNVRVGYHQIESTNTSYLKIKNAAGNSLDVLYARNLLASGEVSLIGGGPITTSSNGNLQLLPDGTGITKVGDAGNTSHSLDTNDDLFVTGQLEVDGITYHDNFIYFFKSLFVSGGSHLRIDDNIGIAFGTDEDCKLVWDETNGLVDSITGGGGPLALPCPQVGSLPTLQTNNTVTFGVDETNDELEIRVKDSGGTIRSTTVSGLT